MPFWQADHNVGKGQVITDDKIKSEHQFSDISSKYYQPKKYITARIKPWANTSPTARKTLCPVLGQLRRRTEEVCHDWGLIKCHGRNRDHNWFGTKTNKVRCATQLHWVEAKKPELVHESHSCWLDDACLLWVRA